MDTAAASAARYSRGAIALHWIIALLIAFNFAAAWLSEDMTKEQELQIMSYHKAVGLTILALTVLRLLWRFAHRPPPLHEGLKAWEVALARVTHALFYLLMLGMPLSGWLMHSAFSGGKPVGYFGLFNLPGIPMAVNKPLGGVFHEMHELGGYAMLALFALHVAGALKHQFLDRHPGAIARILPGRG